MRISHSPANAGVVEMGVRLRRHDHRRIVQRVLPEQPFFRRAELRARLDDQKEIVIGLRHYPVGNRARHHDVVALLERQRTEIGFDDAGAAMHEDQLVAIGVAVIERHRLRNGARRIAYV